MANDPRPLASLPEPADGSVVGCIVRDDDLPRESPLQLTLIRAIALVAIVVSLGYLTWRLLDTLGTPWIAIPLWLLEAHAVFSLGLFTFSLWDVHSVNAPEPVSRTDLRVAMLIPTYNEPREVLLPTVAGALALSPAHETWVLDDGDRDWVRDMCDELGARYLRREVHDHAKAGNINHALAHVDADVIGILDADHVPAPGFLTETLGYFDDPQLALVQTPQDFYNRDSFEHDRNRSLLWRARRSMLFSEQALFYRVLQPGKNRWNAAFWCGTNAVVRLDALREVGGVATETLTEDIDTTIRLHRLGWKTRYHNRVLAHGLAARNASEYLAQRLRWGTGAMQVLKLERPFTRRGLSVRQKLAYGATLLGWFDAWRTLGYVLLPILVLATGAMPVQAPLAEFLVFFGTAFVLQRLALAALSRGLAPQGMATVFELIRMPANLRATLRLVRPGTGTFEVTRKGASRRRHRAHAPRMLVTLIVASIAALGWYGLTLAGLTPVHYGTPWVVHGACFWLVVNLVFLVVAVRRVRAEAFAGERRRAVRLPADFEAQLDDQPVSLLDVSMSGALVSVAPGPQIEITPGERPHTLLMRLPDAAVILRVIVRSRREVSPTGTVLLGVEFAADQDRAIARLAAAVLAGSSLPDAPVAQESSAA